MIKELTTLPTKSTKQLTAFSGTEGFEEAQRMAKLLASSNLVPDQYRNNMANCVVALEMAQRIGASPLAVLQSLNIIHGRPSWSSSFIIAALNSCGRFKPLKYRVEGEGDDLTCTAWTTDETGEILEGPPVSIRMAKDEGWFSKNGSKWKTLPQLMLRYRAAAFFGRLYAPDILMGMRTEEEVVDMIDVTPRSEPAAAPESAIGALKSKIAKNKTKAKEEEVIEATAQRVDENSQGTEEVPPKAEAPAAEEHF